MKEKLVDVPKRPGVYLMKDDQGRTHYVGKAKNLKSRLSSYFTGSHDYKTQKMVAATADFDYIVTLTEIEALILELDLIKKEQPRYNVLLTDDKTYPYIEITTERHPKLRVTRNVKNKKNRHIYGPFPDVRAARETLRILNKLYPLRKCQRLPGEACLYWHLGQCLAPCINTIEKERYEPIKKKIDRFLRGHTKEIVAELEEKMAAASEKLQFERAQEYKDTIEAIKKTTGARQSVNLKDATSRDVVGIAEDEEFLALTFLFVRNGKISATDKRLLDKEASAQDALGQYLGQFYRNNPIPREILVDGIEDGAALAAALETNVHIPKRGVKRRLLDMAKENAQATLKNERLKTKELKARTFGALEELAEELDIPTPYRIEAFDNAHLFGSHATSAVVVFVNGRPHNELYRKFKLKAAASSSDSALLEEAVYRRYRRLLMEEGELPDLILVDGGIQQMQTTKEVLSALGLSIPVAGMVKSQDHKTHHLLDSSHNTIALAKTGRLFRLLSRIQEEAHRFATEYHKKIRGKGLFESVLDDIEGVGPKTKKKLLSTFKTVKAIRAAEDESLRALGIPEKTIKNIKLHLEEKDKDR